jgi:DNA-binding CsgD family transcriptional regulator
MSRRRAREPDGPLLERESQLRRLDEALDAARAGRGSVAVVEGVAGVGKSTLLAYASDRAGADGFLVLRAKGDELESLFPFGVAIQLLAEPAQQLSEEDPGVVAGTAQLALPLLRGESPASPAGDPRPEFTLLHGLHWIVAGLAERSPLLIAVDDAHWADPLTLRFLLYLARRGEALPVAIALTTRSGETPDPEAGEHLARLRAQPLAFGMTLRPLEEKSVQELIALELSDADAALGSAFYEATGGNPFLLRELLAAARDERPLAASEVGKLSPAAIRSSILVRLAGLGAEASRLARAVAIIGPAASLQLAGQLAELDGEAAAATADALVAAHILAAGQALAFVHPIVREAVYADFPLAQRRRAHLSAARLLHDAGGPSEEIVSHLLIGEPSREEWATAVLRKAAGLALGRGASGVAVRLLRRALEDIDASDEPALLLELGLAELAAADPAAVERLEAAGAATAEPLQRAAAAGALGQALFVAGDSRGAFESVLEALAEVPPGQGGAPEAELLFHGLVSGRLVPALVDDVRAQLARERKGPDGEPTLAEVMRRSLVAFDAVMQGDRDTAAREIEWVQAQVSADEADAWPSPARTGPALCLLLLGRCREAQALLDRELDRATRRGSMLELAVCLEVRIGVSWSRGDVNGSLADAETLLGLNEEGWETATVATRVLAADMLLERDDRAAAESMLAPAEEVEQRLPGTLGWLWLPYGRTRLAGRAGDWKTALEQALAAGERLLEIQAPSPDYLPWRSLAARAAARLGDRERAVSLAGEELDLARSAGSRRATGIALAALGAIRGGSGLELLAEAVDELDRTEAELEPARVGVELGAALRRARRLQDARRPLEEALDSARRLGSTYLAGQALGELRAAGGRPRRLALSGVESLTPSQSRVAAMAAQGMSNREIAQALFVTRRTVETHLTHAYAKLDIDSRDELSAVLEADAAKPRTGTRPDRS